MIQISDLDFQYRDSEFRLRVPKMQVARGETVALIGPSGSGKTTILNLVAGILTPHAGRISTNEVEVSTLGEGARRAFRVQNIGLVFQEFELLEHLTVLDNILLPCRITPAIQLQQAHRERAAALAREVGLADKLRRFVRKLSQGERQRVAICRALLLEPPLLLCDEPTGNLDPINKAHVLKILFDYVRRHNTTLLTVTHDYELLSHFDETIDCKQFHDSNGGQA
jgi:putative ABC transport system ATP-binding protein